VVDPGISEKLDAVMEAGFQAMIAGHFDEAEVKYKEAVELAEKLQPRDNRLATSLLRLANCYAGKKDFPKTEAAIQRALTETEKLYGPESPMMTEPLQALGQYSAFRGDLKSALDFDSRAVKINEDTFGETSDRVADSLRILASVYVMQKEYDKAEPYLLRSVRIEESLPSQDGFRLGLPLNSLCDLYDKWNKPEMAEPRYRQLLALLEKQYGPDSPVLISTLARESKSLQVLGHAEEAAKVDQRLQALRAATGQPEGQPSAELPK
jgi:tetratricopeptide (TPR) repeat protein